MKEELHTRSVWHRFTASFMAMLMLLSILTTMPVMAASTVNSVKIRNDSGAEIYFIDRYEEPHDLFTERSGTIELGNKKYNVSDDGGVTKLAPSVGGVVSSLTLKLDANADNIVAKVLNADTQYLITTLTPGISEGFEEGHYLLTFSLNFLYSTYSNIQNIEIQLETVKPKYTVSLVSSDSELNVTGDLYIGSKIVEKDTVLNFKVSADPGKVVTAKKSVTGKKDETLIAEATESGEKWTYEFTVAVDSNMQISLSSKPKTYTVTVEGLDGEGFTTSLGNPKTYSVSKNYNDEFSFTLTPDDGYEPPVVKSTNGNTINKSGNVYTIPHVTQDTTITIEAKGKKKYSVSYVTKGEGFTATAEADDSVAADGTIDVEYDKDLTYTVTVDAAYSQSTPAVTANGKTYTLEHSDGNVYTFKVKITGETNITVSGLTLNKYTVTYNGKSSTVEYSTNLTKSKTVTHGDSIDFTVTPKTGYVAPKVTVTPDDKATLTSSENTYTLSNITGDVEVVITAGGKTEHTVTLPSKTDSYTLEVKNGEADVQTGTKVNYGDKITIKVTLNDDYSKSNPTVSVNGVPLNGTKDGKVYTCDEYTVNSNISISVSGVTKNTYTVAIPHGGEGYSVTANGGNTVTHGGSLSFTVAIDDGYQYTGSENYRELLTNIISGADVQVTLNGTRFTVTLNSITADIDSIVINEQNIKPIEYKVELKGDGVNYDIDANNVTKLPYNNSGFTFTVTPDTGYKIDSVKYSTGSVEGADLAPSSGSTPSKSSYTVPAVSADVTVTVTVKPIDVNVTYTWGDIDIGGGALIPGGSNTVTYKNEGTHSWNVNGEKVEIKLPDETKYKGFTCTWSGECDSDCITIDAEDSHTDLAFTVNGTFTVKAPEKPVKPEVGEQQDTGSIPFVKVDVQTTNNGEVIEKDDGNVWFSWTAHLNFSTEDKTIIEALKANHYQIEAYGFLLSRDTSINADLSKLETLSSDDWVGSSDPQDVRAYYNANGGEVGIGESNQYNFSSTISIELTKTQGDITRTGAFWFRVRIGDKVYVYVSSTSTLKYNYATDHKESDESEDDEDSILPESEEVLNDAGEEEVPSAEA